MHHIQINDSPGIYPRISLGMEKGFLFCLAKSKNQFGAKATILP